MNELPCTLDDLHRLVQRAVRRAHARGRKKGKHEGREEVLQVMGRVGKSGWDGLVEKAWSEDSHPRDDQGRFVSKEALEEARTDPEKAKELRDKVTDPEQRKKLDAAIGKQGKPRKTPVGELTPKEQLQKQKADKEPLRQAAREHLEKSLRGEGDISELRTHIEHLTRDEIREHVRALEAKVGGKKAELADRLIERVKAKVEAGKAANQDGGNTSQFTKEESEAFRHYSEEGAFELNRALRNGDELTPDERALADTLSKTIRDKGNLREPVDVYRALSWSHKEDMDEFLARAKTGETLEIPGFQSTSKNRQFVEDNFGNRPGGAVLMKIRAKQGIAMKGDLTQHDAQEEILLDNNSKFKVGKVYEENGKTVVEMDQVGNDPALDFSTDGMDPQKTTPAAGLKPDGASREDRQEYLNRKDAVDRETSRSPASWDTVQKLATALGVSTDVFREKA